MPGSGLYTGPERGFKMINKKHFYEGMDLPTFPDPEGEIAFFKKILFLLSEGQEIGWGSQTPAYQYADFSIKKEGGQFHIKADVESSFWEEEVFSTAEDAAEFMTEGNFYLFLEEAIFAEEEKEKKGKNPLYLSGYTYIK